MLKTQMEKVFMRKRKKRRMSNILFAINNIIKSSSRKVTGKKTSSNRINSVGEGLEVFIKDAFSDSMEASSEKIKIINYNKYFSYCGNKNNPPDLMIKGGDAVEVKKIQSLKSGIALNSSYPKKKLKSSSPLITSACRDAEKWSEKDIIYAIGTVENDNLKKLWMVYGDVYAASSQVYERIKNTITKEIRLNTTIDFTDTNEIAKIKKVDPLGITDLRVRGMWHIKHPIDVFNYAISQSELKQNNIFVIMLEEKYKSLPEVDKRCIEKQKGNKLSIKSITIKDPNNPANLLNAKIIYANV